MLELIAALTEVGAEFGLSFPDPVFEPERLGEVRPCLVPSEQRRQGPSGGEDLVDVRLEPRQPLRADDRARRPRHVPGDPQRGEALAFGLGDRPDPMVDDHFGVEDPRCQVAVVTVDRRRCAKQATACGRPRAKSACRA